MENENEKGKIGVINKKERIFLKVFK